jgi:hypothetical protein
MDLARLLLEENVGGWDLALRAFIGIAALLLLAMGLVPEGDIRWVVALVSLVCLYTAIMRHCTLYPLLGFSTKR